jgi:hypothetical protein
LYSFYSPVPFSFLTAVSFFYGWGGCKIVTHHTSLRLLNHCSLRTVPPLASTYTRLLAHVTPAAPSLSECVLRTVRLQTPQLHTPHKIMATRGTATIRAMKILGNTICGLSHEQLCQLTLSTVLPVLKYGYQLWWGECYTKSNTNCLQTALNGAL